MDRLPLSAVLRSALVVAGALAVNAAHAAMPGCTLSALNALGVPGMTFTSATDVAATASVPEYCRVVGVVASPSGNPHGDGFAIDLPAAWSGRFLMNGGGGFAGGVNGPNTAALSKGIAEASTDTGHTGGTATFALSAPHVPATGAIADYFYLAVHNVTAASKQLIKAFYGGAGVQYAYFQGCSTGGRQALVEAERYPDDFDGIIAGDPFMTHHLVLEQFKGELALLQPSSAYISPAQLPAIDSAVYANCDAKDGLKDNLIQNPQACSFDPRTLLCGVNGNTSPGCLTQVQADALSKYIRPITVGGKVVIPGYPVSDLGGPDGMSLWFLGSSPPTAPNGPEPWTNPPFAWSFADQTIKYFVEEDPNYDIFNFDLSSSGAIGRAALSLYDQGTAAGNADDPRRLLPYLGQGKKLLIYHGFSDGGLSPYPTIRLYKELASIHDGSYRRLQRGARLFMVPGMHHCSGGPGPNIFDTLTPLQNWVEHGQAPDGIIATHHVNNSAANPVDRTMPLCKFPEQARYSGKGDVNDAANWSCPSGDRSLLKIGPNGAQAGLVSDDEHGDDGGHNGDDDEREDGDR